MIHITNIYLIPSLDNRAPHHRVGNNIFQQLRFTSVYLIFADHILLEMERQHMAQMAWRWKTHLIFFRGTHSDANGIEYMCHHSLCDIVQLMLFG